MAVYRFIFTFLALSLFAFASNALAAPQIDQPSAGSTLAGSAQTFSWIHNDADNVDQWWLYVGTSVGARDIANSCLLYTSPSPRDGLLSRMPSSA